MFDYERVEQEITDYCGDYADDFDIQAIVEDLYHMLAMSIDDVDSDNFIEILQRHDLTENQA